MFRKLAVLLIPFALVACGGGGSNAVFDDSTSLALESIEISPTEATIKTGETSAYTANGFYNDGTQSDITGSVVWQSTDVLIAEIDETGLAQGVGKGITNINAQQDGVSASAVLTVVSAVIRLEVFPPAASLAVGVTQDYRAIAHYSDGSTKNVTFESSWELTQTPPIIEPFGESSSTLEKEVDKHGTAIAIAVGEDILTATFEGFEATTSVKVVEAELLSITVAPFSESIPVGAKLNYVATGTYSDGISKALTKTVEWESSGPSIASVSNVDIRAGEATGLAEGLVEMSATQEGITGSTQLWVSGDPIVQLDVFPPSALVPVGSSQQYQAVAYHASGESEDVTGSATWVSSNPDAATIETTGLARGVTVGTSTITAEFGATTGTAQIDVVEALLTNIVIEPAYNLLFPLQVQQYEAIAYYGDGTSRNVTNDVIWNSGDTEIFQISNSSFFGLGLGMGLSQGDTNVFAELPGSTLTGKAEVSVVAGDEGVSIRELEISPPNASIIQGDTQQYEVYLVFEGGDKVEVTGLVSWTSSDNTIAVFNEQGVAHGESAGSVDIQARFARLSIDVVSTASLTVKEGVTVEAIVVSPPNEEIISGDTQQFEAVALLSDGRSIQFTEDADWSTSDSAVASIEPDGLSHGESQGITQVVATLSHQGVLYQGEAVLTVLSPVTIKEIVVSPPVADVLVGHQLQYYATARLSDGRDVDVTIDVSWQTSDVSIAQINLDGLATGVLGGQVSVVATLLHEGMSYTGDAGLTVSDASVDVSIRNIEITPHQAHVLEGKSVQLKAVAVLTDLSIIDITHEANWFSESTMIGTVESGERAGLVTGTAEGSTLVYVEFSYDGFAYPCLGEADCEARIFVEAPVIEEIQVIPATSENVTGNDQQYQAFARLNNGKSVEVTSDVVWKSNDVDIASVTQKGVATGLAEGDAQIQATLDDAGITFDGFAALKVLPIAVTIDEIVVTPVDEKILVSDQLQYAATAILSDGSSVDITNRSSWSAASPDIAHIDTTGLASGLAEGLTVIEAAVNYEGVRYAGSTNLQVDEQLVVSSVQVTPKRGELLTNGTLQYEATAVMSDQSTRNVTRESYWSTKDPSVAVVGQGETAGFVTGVVSGSTNVYAEYSYQGQIVPCIDVEICQGTVSVFDPVNLEGIQVTPEGSEILVDGLQQFKSEAIFSDGEVRDVTSDSAWSSSDNSIAQLQEKNGLFVGFAEGNAEITAQYFDGDETHLHTVNLSVSSAAITVEQLVVEPASTEQLVGHSGFYSATAILSDSTDMDMTNSVVWTSSDTQVAAIDPSTGEATARAEGTAKIKALLEYGDESISDDADLKVKMPAPVSLSVTPSAEVLPAGGSVLYSATLAYDDGTSEIVTRNVTWASGDDEIAFVSNATGSKGLASALSIGITTISAAHESGLIGQASLEVLAAEFSFFEVEPASVSLDVNTSTKLTALAHFSDNSVLDVTLDTKWSSDDTSIASVGNNESAGKVVTYGAGTTNILALYNGVQVSVPTEVRELTIVSSRIEPQDITLPAAVTKQYRAIADYSDGSSKDVTDNVTWTSSETDIASISNVSSGLATTASAGTTEISASFDGAAVGATNLTVSKPDLTSIDVDPASVSVHPGEPIYYAATGNYSDGSSANLTLDVTWVSSNPNIVAIDSGTSLNMVALALQNGHATIKAMLDGAEGSGSVEVASEDDCGNGKPESIIILEDKTVQKGFQVQFNAIGIYKDSCRQDLTDRSNVKFTSDDDNVCKIDNKSGVATGISVGVASITASWGNGGQLTEGSGTCTVVVL